MRCAYCTNSFARHDDTIIRCFIGFMENGRSGSLYCEPVLEDDKLVAYHFHELCFQDGPEAIYESVLYIPQTAEGVNVPFCTVCEQDLLAGDKVYCIQIGEIKDGNYINHPLCTFRDPDSDAPVEVRAVYVHMDCIEMENEMWFPQIAGLAKKEEVIREIAFEQKWDY